MDLKREKRPKLSLLASTIFTHGTESVY